jgi:uncharacterized protein (DUF4415 family)
MAKQKLLTDDQGEVRELTAKDFARAKPFSSLPDAERNMLSARKRGPQKEPTKEMISIRLSPEVVYALRSSGRGWQARVDAHLRKWVSSPAWQGKKSRTKTA